MEHRNDSIANVSPTGRRKLARIPGVASEHPGYWTDSSMDLRAGLDIVEVSADTQWADTLPFEIEPPHRGSWITD